MTAGHLVRHAWSCAFRTCGGACDCVDRIVINAERAACRPEDHRVTPLTSLASVRDDRTEVIMGDDDRQTWSLRAIARASGLTADTAVSVARAGLVPGYEGSSRSGAGISSELAEDLVKVMADRCYTIPFANLIKTDPERALLTVKALERITLASIEHSREAATGEAAA